MQFIYLFLLCIDIVVVIIISLCVVASVLICKFLWNKAQKFVCESRIESRWRDLNPLTRRLLLHTDSNTNFYHTLYSEWTMSGRWVDTVHWVDTDRDDISPASANPRPSTFSLASCYTSGYFACPNKNYYHLGGCYPFFRNYLLKESGAEVEQSYVFLIILL